MQNPGRDGPLTIGWCEFIALPDWGVSHIKAKADTGARTSAIDVADLQELPDGRVRFDLVVDRRHPGVRVRIEARVVRRSRVKSSLGAQQTRPVVETRVRVGDVVKSVQFGLVCRKRMLCRMLLGRAALAPDLQVDPGRRYLHGKRPRRAQPDQSKACSHSGQKDAGGEECESARG